MCNIYIIHGFHGLHLVPVMAKQKALYDISFKLKAVKYAEEHSKEGAARHFNVDGKRIRECTVV